MRRTSFLAFVLLGLAGCGANVAPHADPVQLPFANPSTTTDSERAPRERLLYAFQGSPDGETPYAGVIADATGALYGDTVVGGLHEPDCGSGGCGIVFRLTPYGAGYSERAIYKFRGASHGGDGDSPTGTLAFGPDGLYGTTYAGGTTTEPLGGTIFTLTASGSNYTERVVHRFAGYPSDGATPYAGLTPGKAGTFYGTTAYGGSFNTGTAFELTTARHGYTETVLHDFGAYDDGAIPTSAVVLDVDGTIYGTTSDGGKRCGTSGSGCGVVFKLTPVGSGYAESVIHRFRRHQDGGVPVGTLLIGQGGALYGTTTIGGPGGCGTIFKLTPKKTAYAIALLHSFDCGKGGGIPDGGLIANARGTIYGTTAAGGYYGCDGGGSCGTIFKLKPSASGYTESVVYHFRTTNDGSQPYAALTAFGGKLYGTTIAGGHPPEPNGGTVFEFSP